MKVPHLPTAFAALWRAVRRLFSQRSAGPLTVDESVAAARLQICQACPYNDNGQCTVCTCFISLKVMLSTETCPKNLWK